MSTRRLTHCVQTRETLPDGVELRRDVTSDAFLAWKRFVDECWRKDDKLYTGKTYEACTSYMQFFNTPIHWNKVTIAGWVPKDTPHTYTQSGVHMSFDTPERPAKRPVHQSFHVPAFLESIGRGDPEALAIARKHQSGASGDSSDRLARLSNAADEWYHGKESAAQARIAAWTEAEREIVRLYELAVPDDGPRPIDEGPMAQRYNIGKKAFALHKMRMMRMAERERQRMAEQDEPSHLADRERKSEVAVALFMSWATRIVTPTRLLLVHVPPDVNLAEYCVTGDLYDTANPDNVYNVTATDRDTSCDLGRFVSRYQHMVDTRRDAITLRDKERTLSTAIGNTRADDLLFWLDVAMGSDKMPHAGLPSPEDVTRQAEFLHDRPDIHRAIRAYLSHSYEILDVPRSQSDPARKDRVAIHKQEKIKQANLLAIALWNVRVSNRSLMLTRFQKGFSGWKELESYFAPNTLSRERVYNSLFMKWRTSNTPLSTSYDPLFTFSKMARLYIIYHLAPGCQWLWMCNTTEAEILLPAGLLMRAVRATVTEAHDGSAIVYVLEVIVRPGPPLPLYSAAGIPSADVEEEEEDEEDEDDGLSTGSNGTEVI